MTFFYLYRYNYNGDNMDSMTITIAITSNIICFIFCVILTIIYYGKESLKNKENEIYSKMLLFNIMSLIAELFFYMAAMKIRNEVFISYFEKFYYVSNCIWMYLQSVYIFAITNIWNKFKVSNASQKKKKTLIFLSIFIIAMPIIFLPIEHSYNNGLISSSSGGSPYFMFMVCIVLIFFDIVALILKFKEIEKNKAIPLMIFMLIITIEMLASVFGLKLLLITLPMTLVSYLMYHTIENPDIKMLEQVSLAKDQAEQANHAKSDFLSNMSHEIRTPLNAIVGFSESLKDDNIPESAQEKVSDIIMASNNLLEIVNGILDISKIEANKLEIINKEYDIHSMLDELVALTKARIGDKGLDFRVNIDPSIPSVLYGDNVRIKQVILNILTNAVKYTKEGFVDFTISSVIKDNVCRLIISVEDSGIGIKEESLPKLFSKFERLDVEKQMTIEGTGLGLAITKKLIDLMNGKVIVQSVYGKGSKFTVSIDQRIIAVNKPVIKESQVSESKYIDAHGARILIVDDNELNIKVASTLMKKYHFDIDSCTSGLECIAKIKNNEEYEIIFLDDMMPRLNGRETLKKLKEIESFNIPVIALTANAIEGMKQEYLDCGFDDYLSKPIEKLELERVIKKYINKRNNDSVNGNSTTNAKSLLEKEIDIELPVLSKEKTKKESNPETKSYTDKKILLVDDNDLNIKVAENFLKKYDLDITSVNSGSKAIEKAIETKYDLIFLDDMMPEMDGCKTLESLKTLEDFVTPVIMMTASSEDEVKNKIDEYGFAGYLSKPFKKEILEDILKEHLN